MLNVSPSSPGAGSIRAVSFRPVVWSIAIWSMAWLTCFATASLAQTGAPSDDASAASTEDHQADRAPHVMQTTPVVLGTSHRFRSEILGEDRILNIWLPPSYDADSMAEASYPVVYLLDGAIHEDYHHVAGLVSFLVTYQMMPESILVGIANVHRYHDFTHPTTVEEELERIPDAGGSAEFMRFLRHEVRPYVESTFRTSGPSTLIGQSMGGLIASEIFIRQGDLFDQYIIVSPSLWWAEGSLIQTIDEALKTTPERSGQVVVALGTEGEAMQQGVDHFVAALEAHAPAGLTWHHLSLPDESHATILHRAVYQAFERIYGESHPGMGRPTQPDP